MTKTEFISTINLSKRWKTIKYITIGGFIVSVGFLWIVNINLKLFGDFHGQTIANNGLGAMVSFMGLSMIYSAIAKKKIHTFSNSKNQAENERLSWMLLSTLGSNDYFIQDNFASTTVGNKFLNDGYVINLLSLDKIILYNIDVPGEKQQGITTTISTLKLKRKILKELKKNHNI